MQQQDQRQPRDLLKADRRLALADQLCGADAVHLLFQHGFRDQVLFRGRVINQREIDLRGHQVQQSCAGQALGQRQFQVRMLFQHRAHQGHADRLHRRIRHPDRNIAGDHVAAVLDLAFGGRHRAQDDAGVLVEPLAGRGRLHAARLALEQRHGELGFQIGDVMAERGLRHIGLIRRPRQVALLVDGDEIAELAGIHGRMRSIMMNALFHRLYFSDGRRKPSLGVNIRTSTGESDDRDGTTAGGREGH